MIEGIFVMSVFILSMNPGSWLAPTPTLPTPSMDWNSIWKMAGDMHLTGLLIGLG